MVVAYPDSTLNAIRLKVRRLTASPSEQSLSTDVIDQAINTFYQNDFPYGIKMDQMRDVYTFFTTPYVDTYPLNVNFNQGVRAPVYVDGVKGYFYKDRDQFYYMWPRWPTTFQPASGDGTTQTYSFSIPGPIVQNTFILGCTDTTGGTIHVTDIGTGILYFENQTAQVSNPPVTSLYPGMYNKNNPTVPGQLGPGDNQQIEVGSINYITGQCIIDFSSANVTPASGSVFTVRACQYNPGRPYCLLFWNNEFIIRPIPKEVHKVEVETYLTPVQFLKSTDNPILMQWWQYISYGAAMEILRERQDIEGVENLREGFMRQEALVLERQSVEEIGARNTTIFSATIQNQNWNNSWGWPY